MKTSSEFGEAKRALTVVAALVWACTVGSPTAYSAEPAKAPRGEPIKPLAPRGEPIKPLAPATPPATTTPATPAAPSAAPSAAAVLPAKIGDYNTVGFDKLASFKYDVPEDNTPPSGTADPDKQIPQTVKDFGGKRVALKGFMLPLKVEGGLVTELLIMRDQSMCCYGAVPKINEWVSVKMTSKGVKPIMDQPVTMFGTLKVGAIRENGYLVGIYAMDGDKIDSPGL